MDKIKKLTEITNKIKALRHELDILLLSRKAIMNEYLDEPLITEFDKSQDDAYDTLK